MMQAPEVPHGSQPLTGVDNSLTFASHTHTHTHTYTHIHTHTNTRAYARTHHTLDYNNTHTKLRYTPTLDHDIHTEKYG